jgi:hypothetical protein
MMKDLDKPNGKYTDYTNRQNYYNYFRMKEYNVDWSKYGIQPRGRGAASLQVLNQALQVNPGEFKFNVASINQLKPTPAADSVTVEKLQLCNDALN